MKTISIKKQLLFYLCIMLLCLKLVSCAGPYYYNDKKLEQTVLDYYDYKEGSYWIYQDSIGNIDSTWISSYSKTKLEYNTTRPRDYLEKLEYYINSSFQERIYANIQPSIQENHTVCDWVTQSNTGASIFSWSINHNSTGFYARDGKIVQYKNSVNVNGIDYSEVFVLKSDTFADNDELYIAKNVGIIRKKKGYSIFNLIRKQVVL